MKTLKWIFLISITIFPYLTFAQEQDDQSLFIMQENLEQLAMEEEQQPHWEDELEELSQRLEDPINLNSATRQQLEQIPFLNDLQIENLLAYIYINGEMKTLYELQMVDEMDKQTIELLLPFVCVRPIDTNKSSPSLKQMLKYGKHEVLGRFDIPFYKRKGYYTAYLGPSIYNSIRYSFRYGDYLQAGVVAEKDAGEPFFGLHNRKGYDFYSYYLLIRNRRRLKTLALGNYRLSFGLGLVLNSGFRLGKSFSLATYDYRSTGIRKHSSTDEYNYFRGIATTVETFPGLEVSAFYSYRTLDGVVKDGVITSIYKTGLHRTESEVKKINCLAQHFAGGNINYHWNALRIGLTGIYYFFNRPYEPNLREYSKYNLRGNHFYNIGLDYSYRTGRFAWMGEAAIGKKGYALLNRLSYTPTSDYQVMLIHRLYAHDYWSMFARSFGESSTPQNENGWYIAAETSPWAHWKLFASVDLFSFPWWKYRISKPSQGTDCRFQVTYTPRDNLYMYINYRYKRKERDLTGTSGEVTLPTYQHKARYRLTYEPSFWRLQTTADYTHFHIQGKAASMGYLLTQAVGCTLPYFPLSVTIQGSYFHSDDYDTRMYAYEKGLLYTFYTPSFYGQGVRYSAHIRYDLNKWFMLLLKFGQTIYQDRQVIGSGNDLIADNKKADLQVQLRLKF